MMPTVHCTTVLIILIILQCGRKQLQITVYILWYVTNYNVYTYYGMFRFTKLSSPSVEYLHILTL